MTNPTDTLTPIATVKSNYPPMEELLALAEQLGADQSNGDEAQIKFDLMLVENSFYSTLNTNPNRYGTGDSDTERMFKRWTKGKVDKQFHNRKSGSGKKTASNIKKMIRLGECPKWGRLIYDNVNDLMARRLQAQKSGKKIKNAHDCILEYATAQLNSQHLIVGEGLNPYILVKEAEEATEESELEGMRRKASRIVNGKVPASASSKAAAAVIVTECTQALGALARNRVK